VLTISSVRFDFAPIVDIFQSIIQVGTEDTKEAKRFLQLAHWRRLLEVDDNEQSVDHNHCEDGGQSGAVQDENSDIKSDHEEWTNTEIEERCSSFCCCERCVSEMHNSNLALNFFGFLLFLLFVY
jgi:hypothetical protein